jgi:hypothetical protein
VLDVAGFLARHGEFAAVNTANAAKVAAALADAAAQTDPEVFGDLTDQAHGLLTAHFLVSNPTGREARLKGPAEYTTVYLRARELLERNRCAGGWVQP